MTTRDRSLLRVGAVVIVPVVLWLVLLKPYLHVVRIQHESIRIERERLAREKGLTTAARSGILQRADLASRQFVGRNVLVARDPTLLYARATAYVQELAKLATVDLTDASPAGIDSLESGVRLQLLRLQGTGDLAGVLSYVRLVEAGPSLTHIDRLRILPNETTGKPLRFEMEITLYGGSLDGR